MARHFFRHYENPRDWLTIFRAALHLPGAITVDGDVVQVTLKPPDQPRVRSALGAMLKEINSTDPVSVRDRPPTPIRLGRVIKLGTGVLERPLTEF